MNQDMIEATADFGKALEFLEKDAAAIVKLGDALKDDPAVKPATLAEFYFHLRELHERADAAVKAVYHVHDMLNKFLIPTRLKDNGLDAIKVPAVARSFSIVTKTSASFIDKDAGLAWLRETGNGDMIQETVNAGTLAAFCRNLVLEKGIDPPPEIVNMKTYDTTSMVKYRPKPGEGA